MRSKLTIWVGLGVVLLSATVFQALQASAPPAPLAKPVERMLAAEGRVVAYPGFEVGVAAERGGRLVRVLVQEGQTVRVGQLLAELDSDELRAAQTESLARVREAEAELRLAELSRTRREQLVREQVAAAHDLDQATRDLDITRARLETARAEVERLGAQLRKTRILAPIAGTLTRRDVDAGEQVDIGSPIVTVADLGHLRIEGEADEADAQNLALGAPVHINVQGRGDQSYKGVIEELAESVTLRRLKPQDPSRPTDTRILAIKVAFAEPTPLRLGTTVELQIESSAR